MRSVRDPVLTAEQREIRELARDFATRELAPRSAEWDRERRLTGDIVARLGELGFLGMLTPPEFGGLGTDVATYVVALEEIARGDAAVALMMAIQNGPVPRLVLQGGTGGQAARWLPGLASGKHLAAVALSESARCGDAADITTTATPSDNGGWIIDGRERWVTNGACADWTLIVADAGSDGGDGRRRGLFLIDVESDGYHVGQRERTSGLRASEIVDIRLDSVRIGADRVIGDVTQRLAGVTEALNLLCISIGALAVGVAQMALDHASTYARQRRQFGRPITTFGAVRGRLAGMATEIGAARALVMDAARVTDAGRGERGVNPSAPTILALQAKLFASEMASSVTEDAVRVFGGYGFMSEYPVEKLMRDAKGFEVYGETSEVLRWMIGGQV